MKEALYRNVKTGSTRKGWWSYYWPGDFFTVQLKGLVKQRVYGDHLEYGNWKLVETKDRANTRPQMPITSP